jgi:hypothetical protein
LHLMLCADKSPDGGLEDVHGKTLTLLG